jgi:hypothetical protein
LNFIGQRAQFVHNSFARIKVMRCKHSNRHQTGHDEDCENSAGIPATARRGNATLSITGLPDWVIWV